MSETTIAGKVKKFYSRCKNYLYRKTYNRKCEKVAKQNDLLNRKTSITDNNDYPMFCYMASEDDWVFKTFRRNPVYTDVLEHVTNELALEYLDIIKKNEAVKFTDADWDDFRKNDAYGSPIAYTYQINGRNLKMTPTTIRYAKVLQDIVSMYDITKMKKVAEIGIGYAGQCRLLTSYIKNIESYSLIDLPEVVKLARKFLSAVGTDISKINFIDGTKMEKGDEYDFVISNYAFSELVREVQDGYLEKVILKSKAGYMTWNSLSRDKLGGYSVEELLAKIPGSSVIEEKPLTAPDNCIIIWGNK